ncbi:AraC family transcriptional regulator [Saccharothrix sp. S26]|uniref:AraC family transcriptional regulator n=1 Tax=Saccharothrix sp. S26 TaxID=2907215 RepID=UPI001F1625B5|nr:AraC family transcriptional regulator [Saccharothrix sp. S26]MCE6994154.1 AraC family transcriptional regulator [Saccharothrix sp. S26]
MDVLSDVIAVMRTGRPVVARVAWEEPWAQRFAPVPGASGFQVVLEGSCWLLRDHAEPVELHPGDVVFLPDGRGHVLADSPTTPVAGEACDPNAPDFAAEHPAPAHPTTVTLCGAYELAHVHPLLRDLPDTVLVSGPEPRAAVALLAAELEHPRLGSDALVPALLDALLLYLLRTWFTGREHATGWAAALNDPVTATALHHIHRDPAHPWTVAGLAAASGLSRAPFAKRFTALVGRPPLTYLTWWRMTTAARLLRETDAPLATIAGRVGYSSEFAFAAAFKRAHGTAPGRYRRAHPTT